MCTVIVARGFPGYQLVMATQRDEQTDRPACEPFIWDGEPKMFAPQDKKRGGTWIGFNDRGVCATVTNRQDITSYCLALHDIEMEGRGDIVPMALEASTAEEAFERVMRLDASRYNGFHFVAADADATYVIWGNGRDGDPVMMGHRVDEPFYVVSNQGVGKDHSLRARKVRHAYERSVRHYPPTPANLRGLLDLHTLGDDSAAGRDGTCIHVPQDTYGSRSSMVARIQERSGRRTWETWYRERPDAILHVCAGSWVQQPDFEIVTPR